MTPHERVTDEGRTNPIDYYLIIDGVREGPFAIDELLRRGMHAKSKVWHQDLSNWATADSLPELVEALGPLPPPPPVDAERGQRFAATGDVTFMGTRLQTRPTRSYQPKDFDTTWGRWAVGAIAFVSLLALSGGFRPRPFEYQGYDPYAREYGFFPKDTSSTPPFVTTALGWAVAVCVLGMMCTFCGVIYRAWDLIQDGRTRLKPGAAVVGCLIPFVNFVWGFVAFVGLVNNMRSFAKRNGKEIDSGGIGSAIIMILSSAVGAWCLALVLDGGSTRTPATVFAVIAGLIQLAATWAFVSFVSSACKDLTCSDNDARANASALSPSSTAKEEGEHSNMYYVQVGSRSTGPMSLDALLRHGLTRSTLVWRDGLSDWTPAGDLAELAQAVGPLPPGLPRSSEESAPSRPPLPDVREHDDAAKSHGAAPNATAAESATNGLPTHIREELSQMRTDPLKLLRGLSCLALAATAWLICGADIRSHTDPREDAEVRFSLQGITATWHESGRTMRSSISYAQDISGSGRGSEVRLDRTELARTMSFVALIAAACLHGVAAFGRRVDPRKRINANLAANGLAVGAVLWFGHALDSNPASFQGTEFSHTAPEILCLAIFIASAALTYWSIRGRVSTGEKQSWSRAVTS